MASSHELANESRRMEERLRMLRELMKAEKSGRGLSGAGIRWKSAQPAAGAVSRRPGAGGQVKISKPVKVKVLSAQENISKVQSCGQCDKFPASLVCVECTEIYCSVCFAKFHQKGALSKHHVRPLKGKRPAAKPRTEVSDGRGSGGGLLQGQYDEAASAASFQEALSSWRQEGSTAQAQPVSQRTTGCSTDSPPAAPDIKFTTSISYFEKLMMRWHRVNPYPCYHGNSRALEDVEPLNGVSEYNLFFSSEDLKHTARETAENVAMETSMTSDQHSSPSVACCQPLDVAMATSIQQAWLDSSQCKEQLLSQFFLSGVEPFENDSTDCRVSGGVSDQVPLTRYLSSWAIPSGNASPPLSTTPTDSSCDSQLMIVDEGDDDWEVSERERCDSHALDCLASELASRLELVDDYSSEEGEGPVDMATVFSEFELYQQKLLEGEL